MLSNKRREIDIEELLAVQLTLQMAAVELNKDAGPKLWTKK